MATALMKQYDEIVTTEPAASDFMRAKIAEAKQARNADLASAEAPQ